MEASRLQGAEQMVAAVAGAGGGSSTVGGVAAGDEAEGKGKAAAASKKPRDGKDEALPPEELSNEELERKFNEIRARFSRL